MTRALEVRTRTRLPVSMEGTGVRSGRAKSRQVPGAFDYAVIDSTRNRPRPLRLRLVDLGHDGG